MKRPKPADLAAPKTALAILVEHPKSLYELMLRHCRNTDSGRAHRLPPALSDILSVDEGLFPRE